MGRHDLAELEYVLMDDMSMYVLPEGNHREVLFTYDSIL